MTPVFSQRQEAVLTSVARALYPHLALGEGPYQRVVAAIAHQVDADPALGEVLRSGIDELSPSTLYADGPDALEAKLRRVEHSAFFRALRPLVARYLYDDVEVRTRIGYPGPSYAEGGYMHRGFDDLSWLPEPRVEEAAEALVEIGSLPYDLHDRESR
jgi:hypothetical protein